MQHISPNFIRVRRRTPRLVYYSLTLACIAGLVIRDLKFLPEGVYLFVLEAGLFVGVLAIRLAILGMTPFEIVAFTNANNRLQFNLVKEISQAEEFEEFIVQLSRVISGIAESTVAISPDGNLDGVPNSSKNNLLKEYRWKASWALGLASAFFSIWNTIARDPSLIFLTFPCSFGGLIFCYLSFVAKERFRNLSILGVLFALVSISVS